MESDEEEVEIPEESKISKILSDKTTRTVVILVLVMLFSTQLCQPENYLETYALHDLAMEQVVDNYNFQVSTFDSEKDDNFK